MAIDAFLSIPGVSSGTSSPDKSLPGALDVRSYRFGVEHAPPAGGGPAGRPDLSDLSVVVTQSAATVPLYVACAAGTHYTSATLSLRRTSSTSTGSETYFTAKLTDVVVTSITEGGTPAADVPTDALSLSFAQIDLSYRPTTSTGSLGTAVTGGWDVASGTPRP